jgi:hypothetical protein
VSLLSGASLSGQGGMVRQLQIGEAQAPVGELSEKYGFVNGYVF